MAELFPAGRSTCPSTCSTGETSPSPCHDSVSTYRAVGSTAVRRAASRTNSAPSVRGLIFDVDAVAAVPTLGRGPPFTGGWWWPGHRVRLRRPTTRQHQADQPCGDQCQRQTEVGTRPWWCWCAGLAGLAGLAVARRLDMSAIPTTVPITGGSRLRGTDTALGPWTDRRVAASPPRPATTRRDERVRLGHTTWG